jgi:hypothetical protein
MPDTLGAAGDPIIGVGCPYRFRDHPVPRTVSPVRIRANDVDGADDVLLHLKARGVLIVRGKGGEDAPVVGVPVVQRDAERLRDIRSLVRNSARSHLRLVSATFRGWVMSRMAW